MEYKKSYLVAHVSSADSPTPTSTLASPTVTETSPCAANRIEGYFGPLTTSIGNSSLTYESDQQ